MTSFYITRCICRNGMAPPVFPQWQAREFSRTLFRLTLCCIAKAVLRYLMKYAQMDYILISPLKTKLILLWLWLGQAAVSLGRHNAPAIHSSEILVSLPNPLVKNRNKLQQIRQQNSDKAVQFLLWVVDGNFNSMPCLFLVNIHSPLTFRGKKFLQSPFSIIQNPSGCRSILSKDDKFDYTTKSMFTKYLIPLDSF